MSMQRFLSAPLLVLLMSLPASTAQAKPRDLATYPLRVTLLTENTAVRHRAGYGVRGVGNVTNGTETRGIAYQLHCPADVTLSSDDEYQARWTQRSRSMEIAVNDGTKLRHCGLTVALKSAVYVRQGDEVKLLSFKEYSGSKGAKASKALRMTTLSAAESDPKRYPLQLDVMNLRWRSAVDGVQTGSGQGNMLTERGLTAVDFTIGCPMKLDPLPDGHYYHARWRGEAGKEMILLVETPGSPSAVCELSTTVLPEVYLRLASGTLQGVPAVEYQRMLRNDANVGSRF